MRAPLYSFLLYYYFNEKSIFIEYKPGSNREEPCSLEVIIDYHLRLRKAIIDYPISTQP